MSSDIQSAYAGRNRPVSSWPLAAAILLTVLGTLLSWAAFESVIATTVVGVAVGSILTVRYGPSWARVLAYGLTVGVVTTTLLAGWVLTNAVLTGADSLTPLLALRPVWPALVSIPAGVPILASGFFAWLRRGGRHRTRFFKPLPLRAIIGIALVILLLGAVLVGAFVVGTFNQSSEPSSPSNAGTGGEPYALVSVTQTQMADGTYAVDIYAYRVENADSMTVTVVDTGRSVTVDAGRTTTLTGLDEGDRLRVTVSREDTTNEVRTVTVGE